MARLPPLTRVRSGLDPSLDRPLVMVCLGPSCSERGSADLLQQLRELPVAARLQLCSTSCLDHCATGPNMVLSQEGRIQTGVQPSHVEGLADLLLPDGDSPSA